LTIIAIDPGREKCGVVLVTSDGQVGFRGVVATPEVIATVERLMSNLAVNCIVLGSGTASAPLEQELKSRFSIEIVRVDERDSTLEARRRFFAENPPHGWRRLIPTSLQVPPVPYDDYAALLLAERFFQREKEFDKT
jgi:RNase H-fold protein (predicted Holliday junction resolvase)